MTRVEELMGEKTRNVAIRCRDLVQADGAASRQVDVFFKRHKQYGMFTLIGKDQTGDVQMLIVLNYYKSSINRRILSFTANLCKTQKNLILNTELITGVALQCESVMASLLNMSARKKKTCC